MVSTAKTKRPLPIKTAVERNKGDPGAKKVCHVRTEEYLPGLLAIGAPLVDPVSGKGVGAVSFDFSVLQHTLRKRSKAKVWRHDPETATLCTLLSEEEGRNRDVKWRSAALVL
jgi:hypothetical protein